MIYLFGGGGTESTQYRGRNRLIHHFECYCLCVQLMWPWSYWVKQDHADEDSFGLNENKYDLTLFGTTQYAHEKYLEEVVMRIQNWFLFQRPLKLVEPLGLFHGLCLCSFA